MRLLPPSGKSETTIAVAGAPGRRAKSFGSIPARAHLGGPERYHRDPEARFHGRAITLLRAGRFIDRSAPARVDSRRLLQHRTRARSDQTRTARFPRSTRKAPRCGRPRRHASLPLRVPDAALNCPTAHVRRCVASLIAVVTCTPCQEMV